MQNYVIKFVSELRQVGGFLRMVSSSNKTDRHNITEILFKVPLSTYIKKTRISYKDEPNIRIYFFIFLLSLVPNLINFSCVGM
jgi:hypothetical protein